MRSSKPFLFFGMISLFGLVFLNGCAAEPLPEENSGSPDSVETSDIASAEQETARAADQNPAVENSTDQNADADGVEQETGDVDAEEDANKSAKDRLESDFSIDDPMSIWVVLNKHRPLDPIDFEPSDLTYPEGVTNSNAQPLRAEASDAVEQLVAAAEADGVYVGMTSAYRSYYLQETLYNNYVARDGEELAIRYSARPGHSEHQTGLTVDFDDFTGCGLDHCFESTPAGIWLQDNAADFGFVMRYPDGFEHITGFIYEPWHYRYVGKELAGAMQSSGVKTLEEWFGLGAAPDYLQ